MTLGGIPLLYGLWPRRLALYTCSSPVCLGLHDYRNYLPLHLQLRTDVLKPADYFIDCRPLERILIDAQASNINHLQHLLFKRLASQLGVKDLILLPLISHLLYPVNEFSQQIGKDLDRPPSCEKLEQNHSETVHVPPQCQDWQGIDKITSPPHSNYSYSIQAGVHAGIDMVMIPYDYPEFIDDLKYQVKNNVIPMSRIDDAVRRILRVKFTIGLFEKPYADLSLADQLGKKVGQLLHSC